MGCFASAPVAVDDADASAVVAAPGPVSIFVSGVDGVVSRADALTCEARTIRVRTAQTQTPCCLDCGCHSLLLYNASLLHPRWASTTAYSRRASGTSTRAINNDEPLPGLFIDIRAVSPKPHRAFSRAMLDHLAMRAESLSPVPDYYS